MQSADIDRLATPSADDFNLLTQVIRRVARRGRLSSDDSQDFAQTVHLKLLERDYDAFRQFSGLSSLSTFLTVMVQRMLVDWRRSQYGTWRPSAAARRLGPVAVALETLIARDGHLLDEAIEILRSRRSVPPAAELRRLAEQLPTRHPRRAVPLDELDRAVSTSFDDPLDQLERDRAGRRLRLRLGSALKQLPEEDRLLIDLRYRRALRVPAIAEALQADSKTLYRRCDKVLRTLRASIADRA